MLRPRGGHLDRGGRHAELPILALRRGADHQEGPRQGESVMIKFHSEYYVQSIVVNVICYVWKFVIYVENLLHYLKLQFETKKRVTGMHEKPRHPFIFSKCVLHSSGFLLYVSCLKPSLETLESWSLLFNLKIFEKNIIDIWYTLYMAYEDCCDQKIYLTKFAKLK